MKALKNLQESLFNVDVTNTNYKTVFLLAINAINNNEKDICPVSISIYVIVKNRKNQL